MKRMNLSVTKCTNTKCGYKVIAEVRMLKCPICNSRMFKDKQQSAIGFLDKDCVVLKDIKKK